MRRHVRLIQGQGISAGAQKNTQLLTEAYLLPKQSVQLILRRVYEMEAPTAQQEAQKKTKKRDTTKYQSGCARKGGGLPRHTSKGRNDTSRV